MPPFIVLGLPRSRTAWLSRFLSYRDWSCGHEEIRHVRSLDDVRSWLAQPCTGTVETAAAPWWRTLQHIRPDIRVVTLRRPPAEVVESFLRTGLPFDRALLSAHITRLDHKLDQIEHRMSTLSVNFADLTSEGTCARVFEHCLPYQHDHAWWAQWAERNVQVDLVPLFRHYHAHRAQIDKVAAQIKCHTLATFARRPSGAAADVTICAEPFDRFFADAVPLFREHLSCVGESPDAYAEKNLPVFRALEAMGNLEVLTARSNGRMFGYLMTIYAPSLERADRLVATPTLFFASGNFPGLGRKLALAAKDSAIARGVHEMHLRAGARGDGPRLEALWRRLGAADHGQLLRLNLKDD